MSTPTLTHRLLEADVAGGASRSLVVRRHRTVRLEALGDGACATVALFAAGRPSERLCLPDTLKAQMQAHIRPPMVLMSDAGRALCSVTGSSLDWHDALCGHSTPESVVRRYGSSDYAGDRNRWRRSARTLLLDELAAYDLDERSLHGTVNFFTKVATSGDERGTLTWVADHSAAGDWVELRTEQDVLLVLATAPHPLDERGAWDPPAVRVTVTPCEPPGPDDPSRTFRQESARALLEAERGVL